MTSLVFQHYGEVTVYLDMKSLAALIALTTYLAALVNAVPLTSRATSATGLAKAFEAKGKVFWGTASDSNRFNDATDSAGELLHSILPQYGLMRQLQCSDRCKL